MPSLLVSIRRAFTRASALAAALPPEALGLISATGAPRPSPLAGSMGAAALVPARVSARFWALAAAGPPEAVGFTSEGGRALVAAGAWARAAVHARVARAATRVCLRIKDSFSADKNKMAKHPRGMLETI